MYHRALGTPRGKTCPALAAQRGSVAACPRFPSRAALLSHGPSEALLGGGLRGAGPHTPAGAWPPFLAADASVSDWQPAVN